MIGGSPGSHIPSQRHAYEEDSTIFNSNPAYTLRNRHGCARNRRAIIGIPIKQTQSPPLQILCRRSFASSVGFALDRFAGIPRCWRAGLRTFAHQLVNFPQSSRFFCVSLKDSFRWVAPLVPGIREVWFVQVIMAVQFG